MILAWENKYSDSKDNTYELVFTFYNNDYIKIKQLKPTIIKYNKKLNMGLLYKSIQKVLDRYNTKIDYQLHSGDYTGAFLISKKEKKKS